jgi:YbgC/YbaW family acyl-CoA thioester hydrolase
MPLSQFTYRRRVQFPETDASGIVHFSNFFKYLEEAEHALWRAAGLSIHERDRTVSWPRVAASFEYKRPLRFEDEFDVHIRIVEMTRVAIRYEAVLKKDGEDMAVGSLTIVCVKRAPDGPLKATTMPPEFKERLGVSELRT